MMDRHDWDEQDQIRLTEESKQALIGALTAQQSNPQKKVCNPHHWRKTALVAAAVAAALVVSVGPEDFGRDPFDGIRFQEELERKAFRGDAASGCHLRMGARSDRGR